jgi:proteasome lid subunit RPN8/RPN11
MDVQRRRLSDDSERVNPVVPVHIWRSPEAAAVDVLIVTELDVYATIHQHAIDALPNETGGFLLGRAGFDARDGCWHLLIDEAVPVAPLLQKPTHFQFTWRDVDRVRSHREGQGKALAGWYHTHPDFGVFLSEIDLEKTHRVLFSEPFQVALVYDPVRARAGYFFWEGAQRIDVSQAPWREFEIAVDDGTRARSGVPSSQAPSLQTLSSQALAARTLSPSLLETRDDTASRPSRIIEPVNESSSTRTAASRLTPEPPPAESPGDSDPPTPPPLPAKG